MPTLTAARGHKRGSSVRIDYNSIWNVCDLENISHGGQGEYSYVGKGGSTKEDIGTIRTVKALNPGRGLSSFEITVVDTGEWVDFIVSFNPGTSSPIENPLLGINCIQEQELSSFPGVFSHLLLRRKKQGPFHRHGKIKTEDSLTRD